MSPKVSYNIQKGKRGYTVNFRHSVVKDKDGKYGLKVHRGIGTTDAAEAQRLAEELERILSDSYWADSSKRTEAYGHFSEVVVDAYYWTEWSGKNFFAAFNGWNGYGKISDHIDRKNNDM